MKRRILFAVALLVSILSVTSRGIASAADDDVTMSPHLHKDRCLSCHLEGEKYPLRTEDPIALCNRCHGTGKISVAAHPTSEIEEASVPVEFPVSDDDFLTCLTCHVPGHEGDTGLFKLTRGGPYENRNEFCNRCHIMEQFAKGNPHLDIDSGEGCLFCHTVRPNLEVDTSETVKFKADIVVLCLRCHPETFHPADKDHIISLDEERAESIPEELPLFPIRKIVCGTCHNPHVAETEGHKLRGGGGMMICSLCHKM